MTHGDIARSRYGVGIGLFPTEDLSEAGSDLGCDYLFGNGIAASRECVVPQSRPGKWERGYVSAGTCAVNITGNRSSM